LSGRTTQRKRISRSESSARGSTTSARSCWSCARRARASWKCCAISLFGRDRVLIQPYCGFATFADNPVPSAAAAQVKIAAMVEAVGALR